MTARHTLSLITAPPIDLTPYALRDNPVLTGTATLKAAAGATPAIAADGPDAAVGLSLVLKGTGACRILANGGGAPLFEVAPTGGVPANYWRFDARPTGNAILQYALGSDPDVSQVFVTKGGGSHFFTTGTNPGNTQFRVVHTASAGNWVQASGAALGGAPTLGAQGADANVPLSLSNKGTAVVRFAGQTTGTAVGTAGAAAAPPAAPALWWSVSVNGTVYRLPLYN
ncbi:hypothetical protein HL658_35670 [Azospirillum sp. RWY-5-1]|uniref:Phage tail protein n=1 Tax=Azospirillum oleiclasticum TaxID=2735135 RepID=A0ABX2TN24_9PROT|nr:hypothetical protein [Azospirillum oleiclasticum]NYZ17911.1 hypothetical protein [Azospirillum oleiclasticum]NYZ25114.1 hypothetical protein [Azospirillum oleiclasticum]